MVMVFEGTENQYSMDGYHKTNLDRAKKVIKQDWDMVFVYDGMEGSGKSVKAQQDAFYCDPTLNIDRITFNPDDFRDQVMQSQKYQAVVYDEAYGGLSSKSAMQKVNKTIVQMLTVIREKNLFIFIVLPSFHDLTKYVALWRSRALVHVYTKQFQRGFFAFYNKDKKKDLYVHGKKFYSYNIPRPNFIGRFTNHYTVDEQEYRHKKSKTSNIIEDHRPTPAQIQKKVQKDIVLSIRHNNPKKTITDIAKDLGVTRQTIHNYLKEKNKLT